MKNYQLEAIKLLTQEEKNLLIDYLGTTNRMFFDIEKTFNLQIYEIKKYMKEHDGRVVLKKLIKYKQGIKEDDKIQNTRTNETTE